MATKTWTEKEILLLTDYYPKFGKIKTAELLGRTEASIRQKTYELKIKQNRNSLFFKDWQERAAKSKIGKKRPEHSETIKKLFENGVYDNFRYKNEERRKIISENTKKYIKENGHPKGFLGKKHSQESTKIISEKSKMMWKDETHTVNSEEYKQYQSDRITFKSPFNKINAYSRAKKGVAIINGNKYYFRSEWEVNIAHYFEFLRLKGEIKKWEYEPDTFWFLKIKRGIRSYKPDFKITANDNTIYYEEVKGYMDDKSKTKLKRMRIYYPNIDIRVLDKKRYDSIKKNSSIIPNWGVFTQTNKEQFIK